MGTSTDAIIALGINLGGMEGDGLPPLIESLLEVMDDDFSEYELSVYEGGLEWKDDFTVEEKKEYYDKRRQLLADYPVEIIAHCSGDYPEYVVAVRGTRRWTRSGYPHSFDPKELVKVKQEDIDAFNRWCKKYEIEGELGWLLFSYWS